MNKLHVFGMTIITLVVAAFLSTPEFFIGITSSMRISIIILIIFLIIIAISSAIQLFLPEKGKHIPAWLPLTLAFGLFLVSSYLFFMHAEYFWYGVHLPMPFWHRVSFYTLPAIALESAIVTGFQYMMQRSRYLTMREQSWITQLFYLYTLMTMAVNFLAIGKIIGVNLHIWIARIVIITSISILIVFIIKHRKDDKE